MFASLKQMTARLALALLITLLKPAVSDLLWAGVFQDLRSPQLNNEGTVAFVAQVLDERKQSEGLFLALSDGSISKVALTGEESPLPGFRFTTIGREFALNGKDNVAFSATVADKATTLTGIFLYSHLERSVRTIVSDVDDSSGFGLTLNERDQAAFVVAQSQIFLYEDRTRELIKIAQSKEGSPDGSRYSSLGVPALNDNGTVVFISGSSRLFRKLKDQPVERLDTGEGVTTFDIHTPLQLSNRETLAFAGPLKRDSLGGILAVQPGRDFSPIVADNQPVAETRVFFRKTRCSGVLTILCEDFFAMPSFLLSDSDSVALIGATSKGRAMLLVSISEEHPDIAHVSRKGRFLQLYNTSDIAYEQSGQILLGNSAGTLAVFRIDSRPSKVARDAIIRGPSSLYGFNDVEQVGFQAKVQVGDEQRDAILVLDTPDGSIRTMAFTGQPVPDSNPLITRVFPHFADGGFQGGAIATSLLLVNGTPVPGEVTVKFRDSNGLLARVRIGDELNHTFVFPFAERGSLFLKTTPDSVLQSGYILVESDVDVDGIEIFSVFDRGALRTEVGVLPSSASRDFKVAVEAQDEVSTGLALANLTSTTAQVQFDARDADGNVVATTTRDIGASEHLALFVARELFPGMCCNFQKAASERLVGSIRLRLMHPPRTAC